MRLCALPGFFWLKRINMGYINRFVACYSNTPDFTVFLAECQFTQIPPTYSNTQDLEIVSSNFCLESSALLQNTLPPQRNLDGRLKRSHAFKPSPPDPVSAHTFRTSATFAFLKIRLPRSRFRYLHSIPSRSTKVLGTYRSKSHFRF